MTTAHVVCQQETITITARQAAAEGVQQQRPKWGVGQGGPDRRGWRCEMLVRKFLRLRPHTKQLRRQRGRILQIVARFPSLWGGHIVAKLYTHSVKTVSVAA